MCMVTTMNHDLDYDYVKQQVESHLNIDIRDKDHVAFDHHGDSTADVHVKKSGNRNHSEIFYNVRVCEVCGHSQCLNYEAYARHSPVEAKSLLQDLRRDEAEEYIDLGTMPKSDKRLKAIIEDKHLNWNKAECDRRHPEG